MINVREPKGLSRMYNPENLATLGTQDEDKQKRKKEKKRKKTQHNVLNTTVYKLTHIT